LSFLDCFLKVKGDLAVPQLGVISPLMTSEESEIQDGDVENGYNNDDKEQ
jgi:hypothetical protein